MLAATGVFGEFISGVLTCANDLIFETEIYECCTRIKLFLHVSYTFKRVHFKLVAKEGICMPLVT